MIEFAFNGRVSNGILTSDFLLDINAARLWLRRPGQRHPLVVAAGPLSLLPGVSAL